MFENIVKKGVAHDDGRSNRVSVPQIERIAKGTQFGGFCSSDAGLETREREYRMIEKAICKFENY